MKSFPSCVLTQFVSLLFVLYEMSRWFKTKKFTADYAHESVHDVGCLSFYRVKLLSYWSIVSYEHKV